MDIAGLRELLRPHITGLGDGTTHARLPTECAKLGLPAPPAEGSKRERMTAVFAAIPDADLPRLLERYIEVQTPSGCTRNALQDWLWSQQPHPEVPKKARRDIARAVNVEDLFTNTTAFDALLNRLWVLDDNFCPLVGEKTLRQNVYRHVIQNRGDWSTEVLFEKLRAFDASDRRFALFLEGLASPEVLTDDRAQRRFVDTANKYLRPHGVELRETGAEGGYPVFTLVSTRTPANRSPKNLIFASSVKPDLRFTDAVDNDIEIVTNRDKVLVYDRPIGADGLRWRDLQAWWADAQGIADVEQAKKTLYIRLRDCLPDNSPPQRFLFETYYKTFSKAVPDLPALLPEVWLHWDPKTVKERGRDALFRFRMDFLILLPHGVRVVLEVDGKHHYADEKGVADTRRYAQMAAADRDLKLSGYEVFRFGTVELRGAADAEMVGAFFRELFRVYKVMVSGR